MAVSVKKILLITYEGIPRLRSAVYQHGHSAETWEWHELWQSLTIRIGVSLINSGYSDDEAMQSFKAKESTQGTHVSDSAIYLTT